MKASKEPVRQPGIKDIADALGISIGTVDRALHARPGVNPTTCARVLRMADKLGYRPNVAARALKLNRHFRIEVQLPKEISSFFGPMREGIRHAAAGPLGASIEMHFAEYPRLDWGDIELLEAAIPKKYDGIVCSPSDAAKVGPLIDALQRQGTTVVCVGSDAPRSERLASIAIDGYVSGSLAAELLIHALPSASVVAAISGNLRILDHAEKLRGYAATLALLAPRISLLPVLESHDSPKEAYDQTKDLLKRHPEMQGLYVSTANSLPVLRAVREKSRARGMRIVTTDLFSELAPMIENGEVMATLYQRPFTQGRLAIQSLVHFLIDGVRPNPITRLTPHIVLRGNLPIFYEYVSTTASISR
ncbi:MAG TPA: LacI family DNA-binding transcriptional regulator [Acidobacteriaceae bacterium]|nr:LacI family DNA-binding transcriptional regulator [Acidobacteriaceae bacterium]